MTALDHQAPDRRQQLGRQQRHVVDHRLELVTRPVGEVAVSQKSADRFVVVRKVVQAVEVAVQPLLQDPRHQDLPQVHPRTPDRAVGLRKDVLVQQREQPRAQRLVRPDVLEPPQHRRNVVSRLRVDPDLVHRHLTDPKLRSVNLSHGVRPDREDPPENPGINHFHRQGYDIRMFFVT